MTLDWGQADNRGAYSCERLRAAEALEEEATSLRARASTIRTTPALFAFSGGAPKEAAFLLDQAASILDEAAFKLTQGLEP